MQIRPARLTQHHNWFVTVHPESSRKTTERQILKGVLFSMGCILSLGVTELYVRPILGNTLPAGSQRLCFWPKQRRAVAIRHSLHHLSRAISKLALTAPLAWSGLSLHPPLGSDFLQGRLLKLSGLQGTGCLLLFPPSFPGSSISYHFTHTLKGYAFDMKPVAVLFLVFGMPHETNSHKSAISPSNLLLKVWSVDHLHLHHLGAC